MIEWSETLRWNPEALRQTLETMGGGWVYEVDIQAFHESLVSAHLRSFLDQRIAGDSPG